MQMFTHNAVTVIMAAAALYKELHTPLPSPLLPFEDQESITIYNYVVPSLFFQSCYPLIDHLLRGSSALMSPLTQCADVITVDDYAILQVGWSHDVSHDYAILQVGWSHDILMTYPMTSRSTKLSALLQKAMDLPSSTFILRVLWRRLQKLLKATMVVWL